MAIETNAKPVRRIFKGTEKVFDSGANFDFIPMEIESGAYGNLGIYVPKSDPHRGYVVGGYKITSNDTVKITVKSDKSVSGTFAVEYFNSMMGSGSRFESATLEIKNNVCTTGGYSFLYAVTGSNPVTIS